MNKLLEKTKEVLNENLWGTWNRDFIKSIEALNTGGSAKYCSYLFFQELRHVLKSYEKEDLVTILLKYVDIEVIVEAISLSHIAHVNHVIQVFFLGILILEKLNPSWNRRKLIFAWMMAALFHDVGYDIERFKEEEEYRKRRNKFWNFITCRKTNPAPIKIKEYPYIKNIINNYIMNNVIPFFEDQTITYDQFINLYKIGDNNDFKYDHGFISALKYHFILKLFDKKRRKSGESNPVIHNATHRHYYRDWSPNIRAIIAMSLHNFRKVKRVIKLESNDKNAFIAYLLIICDEIQLWDSDKPDIRTIPRDKREEKKEDFKIKKLELTDVNVRNNGIELDLKVTLLDEDNNSFNSAKQYIDEKIVKKLAMTYPIQGDSDVNNINRQQFRINPKRVNLTFSFDFEIKVQISIPYQHNSYTRWFAFKI